MSDSATMIAIERASTDLLEIEDQPDPAHLNWLHSQIKKTFHFLLELRFPYLLMSPESDSELNRDARYHQSKLHQNPSYVRDRLHNARILLSVVVGYFAVKSIIVGTAHMLDMTSFDRRRLKNDPDIVPFTSGRSLIANVTRSIMPNYYLETLEQVAIMSDSESFAVRSLSTARAVVQLMIGIALLHAYVLPTPSFDWRPIDAANLRFMLDPSREIRRVDQRIIHHLNRIAHESTGHKVVTDLATQVSTLRPFTFTLEWYHKFYWLASALLIGSSFMTVAFVGLFFYVLFLTAKQSQCTLEQLDGCNHGGTFSSKDAFYVAEMVFGDWMLAANGTFVMFILLLNSICQVVMVQNAEKELRTCRSTINDAMKYFEVFQDSHLYHKPTRFSGLEVSDSLPHDSLSAGWTGRQQDVESGLLKAYINLIITGDEVKRTVRVVGRFVQIYVILSSPAFLIIVITSMVNQAASDMIEKVMLANYWLLTNPILFAAAYVSARTIKLEKIGWSLLADMAKYRILFLHRGNMRLYRSNQICLFTVLEKRWRRLVGSYALSDRSNTIRAFGASLTYGQVLSLDFFLLSTASILRIY